MLAHTMYQNAVKLNLGGKSSHNTCILHCDFLRYRYTAANVS